MKNLILSIAVMASASLETIAGSNPHTDSYKVDTKQSSLEWYGEKVTGKHNGTIMLSKGELNNEHGNLTGTFEIDMNSIEDKDMSDEGYKTKLENHLKSIDFFDAAQYPTSKFVLTSSTPLKEGTEGGFTHNVKGMLTIKDKTNEISFDAIIKFVGNTASCIGSVVVDRSKYDVKYNSKTFFAGIGDKMIYDEFTLKFSLIATK